MRKHWMRYIAVFGAAAITGAALLHTSQDVQQAEEELRAIQTALESERESIRVLEAEWGYLNNPARLEMLARQYLDLAPPTPGAALADPASLPDPFAPVLPARKPVHESAVAIVAKPAVLGAQAETPIAPVAKPPVKPAPPPLPKEAGKSFNDLLKQLEKSGGSQ